MKADKVIEMTGAFDALWITGRMAAGTEKKSLHLVDDSADVELGHLLRASRVEHYGEWPAPRRRRGAAALTAEVFFAFLVY